MLQVNWKKIEKFDWNEGNREKNWQKHKVSIKETEEIFANKPYYLSCDEEYSQKEDRFSILGITNNKRLLAVFFTIRNRKIRIISVRDQDRKEEKTYEKTKKAAKI